MSGVAIVSGCRTPIGDFNKSLSSISPSELGGTAISGALSRAHVEPTEVSLCVMGQVLYAGEGSFQHVSLLEETRGHEHNHKKLKLY